MISMETLHLNAVYCVKVLSSLFGKGRLLNILILIGFRHVASHIMKIIVSTTLLRKSRDTIRGMVA